MINIYLVAAFWFLSALISTIIANRLKISNALMEIIIGACIGFIAFKTGFTNRLALDADLLKFIAGIAAIMLTFLSGAELNPDSLRSKFREIVIVGLVIASAVIPTLIANKFFLPSHLLEKPVLDDQLPDIIKK
jgi:glutathione-regulated potassium-efflux system ancillary protein KefC